ncbi:PHB depolymerase family esterase [Pseudomonadota bacterium]
MKILMLSLVLVAASALKADPQPTPNIDQQRITVSGISAGGQMAHQLHIAYPDLFSGIGVIAGGPFGCANGSLATAMARCVSKVDDSLSVADLAAEISTAAGDGRVGSVEVLADDPVWLFHGALDKTVAVEVSDALAALYADFIPAGQISYVKDIQAAHNFPASGNGHACDAVQAPFVGDCDFDAAGELLNHLYPDLQTPDSESDTTLTTVVLPGAASAGLSETAYLFVPPACSGGEKACAAHLALHGCAQSATQLGTAFIEQSGYLRWAAANDIVLAFPQVISGPANPLACWDWWGYTGANYLWRDGAQMQVLTDWIRSMSSGGD